MAWREAVCTLAFIAGPTLGGWFFSGTKSLSKCIGVTGYLSVLSAGLVVALMVEAPTQDEEESCEDAPDDQVLRNVPAPDTQVLLDSQSNESGINPAPASAATVAAKQGGETEKDNLQTCPLGTGLVTAVATICVVSFLCTYCISQTNPGTLFAHTGLTLFFTITDNAGQSTFDSFFPGTAGCGFPESRHTVCRLSRVNY